MASTTQLYPGHCTKVMTGVGLGRALLYEDIIDLVGDWPHCRNSIKAEPAG